MSGSQAAGCLVVLQGPPTSPDILRALLRTQSQNTVSLTFPVPPSTYTVYGYDLEENGLPNTMPAVIVESEIFISKGPLNPCCVLANLGIFNCITLLY